jgi:hypothetical protein
MWMKSKGCHDFACKNRFTPAGVARNSSVTGKPGVAMVGLAPLPD